MRFFRIAACRSYGLEDLRLEADLFRNSREIPFQIKALTITDCVIAGKLIIDNIKSMDHLRLTSTRFENKFAMINCECDTFTIKNTNFHGLAIFISRNLNVFEFKNRYFGTLPGLRTVVLVRRLQPKSLSCCGT